jgi:hypothetical protein
MKTGHRSASYECDLTDGMPGEALLYRGARQRRPRLTQPDGGQLACSSRVRRVGLYLLPFAAGNFAGPLLLGRFLRHARPQGQRKGPWRNSDPRSRQSGCVLIIGRAGRCGLRAANLSCSKRQSPRTQAPLGRKLR